MTAILIRLIPYLRYWRIALASIAAVALALALHVAARRGAELERAQTALAGERARFRTQIEQLEKARHDDRERNLFRRNQEKTIGMGGGDALRDAYDRLRARQGAARAPSG
jgi:hypothetical protein